MLKRILVGVGGTPYMEAEVRHAIDVAREHTAELTALTVVDLERIANVGPVPIGAGAAAADLVQQRLETARAACQRVSAYVRAECDKAGIRCHMISEAGNPFEELCSLWRYHDLVILSLRSLFDYGVVHDPLDMVVRIIGRGVRPILAVAQNYRPVQRVLIAYNGSMESATAMKQFVQRHPWRDVTVRIVCLEMSRDQATPLLRDAAQYCEVHGLSVETHHAEAKASAGLDHEVEQWGADLLVMGSTARSRLFRYVLGDTAMHMVRHAQVPVFMSQ
jgi:nucleotide-binding universal stress UspA family protein